jgi:hypothetical protein
MADKLSGCVWNGVGWRRGGRNEVRQGETGRLAGCGCQDGPMEVSRRNDSLMVIDGVLDDDDLSTIVASTAGLIFEDQALGTTWLGRRSRVEADDGATAAMLWARFGGQLPPPLEWFTTGDPPLDPATLSTWRWVGLNARLRWYRYGLGADFPPRQDEPWWPDDHHRTLLSVLVYLPTEGCEGGETVIGEEVVAPAPGRIAIFDHRVLHSGAPVERGSKLILRTDVIAGHEPPR